MAGGHGERFWPKSRQNLPKQFLSLTDNQKTMIQLAVERMLTVADMEDIYVVTSRDYRGLVAKQLPELPKQNILAEPVGKNTAPCIAFSAAVIGAKYPDAVMFVVPSDHIVKNIPLFTDTMLEAADIAQQDGNIVTIGITPTYPETGYGYIHFVRDESPRHNSAYRVQEFVEKPNARKAAAYIQDGCYLWNSGMFVWRLQTIVHNFEKYMPDVYQSLIHIRQAAAGSNIQAVVAQEYERLESQSIDYGIMEKASNIYTIPGSFGWDDVGGWLALERINSTDANGNVMIGNVIDLNTENSILISNNQLIASIGVSNLVVVAEQDSILICNKDNTQDVKKVVAYLKDHHMQKYL